jgi:probable HAF family extracellular repeat protein
VTSTESVSGTDPDHRSAPATASAGHRVASALIAWVAALTALAAGALPASAATSSALAPRYSVTVLNTLDNPHGGPPPPGEVSNAAGINDRGWIVGDSTLPGNTTEHATVWRDGTITDLGTLGGLNSSIGFIARPNDTGLISGNSETAQVDPLGEGWGTVFGCTAGGTPCDGYQDQALGFVWKDGAIRPLPTLGGNNALAFGGANDQGQIVGTAEAATQGSPCQTPQVLDWVPVVWGPTYGHVHELPLPTGDNVGAADAINDEGQAVGGSGSCGLAAGPGPSFGDIEHALLWQGGPPIDLGNLGGAVNNVAVAVNDRRQVVGFSDLPGDLTAHAFLWQNGVMRDLGTLPGDTYSIANAIDDHGQVVGQSCDPSGNCRAFLWQSGAMTDLNTIANTPASFDLLTAEGINPQGEIVGNGYAPTTGDTLAFSAAPCGEPAAGNQDCQYSGPTAPATAAARVNLPNTVRTLARQPAGPLGLIEGS